MTSFTHSITVSSLLAPLIPSLGQVALISLIGMNVGVSRQNLPGQGMLQTFYYSAGLLVLALVIEHFIPDPYAEKLKKSAELFKAQQLKATKKKKKKDKKDKDKLKAASKSTSKSSASSSRNKFQDGIPAC